MRAYEILKEEIDLQGYTNLLADFGFFITMNTARIHDYAVDQTATQELKAMQAQFKQPIVNGKTFVEIYNQPAFYKNTKVIPVLLKYVYDMLKYLEPRLQKYLNDEGKSKFLPRIQKIKEQYKQVVSSTHQNTA